MIKNGKIDLKGVDDNEPEEEISTRENQQIYKDDAMWILTVK